MRESLVIPLTMISLLLFIGCEDENTDKSSSIAINSIEKNITKKKTNLGCADKKHKDDKECTQEERNSAQFILNTLVQESVDNKDQNIEKIKENLDLSLQEITQEEHKKNKLKDSLVALVDKVNETKGDKGKNLQKFINSIDDDKLGASNSNKIASIKDELTNLVNSEENNLKPKDMKKRLESLIADVTESKKTLFQTQKSLKKLVKDVEKKDTSSAKKFASAIIKDVSNKRISIVKEDKKFFIVKVKEGDNLSLLAQRYYNDKNKYKLIYESNKDKINSKYEIYPGSKLLIPKI